MPNQLRLKNYTDPDFPRKMKKRKKDEKAEQVVPEMVKHPSAGTDPIAHPKKAVKQEVSFLVKFDAKLNDGSTRRVIAKLFIMQLGFDATVNPPKPSSELFRLVFTGYEVDDATEDEAREIKNVQQAVRKLSTGSSHDESVQEVTVDGRKFLVIIHSEA